MVALWRLVQRGNSRTECWDGTSTGARLLLDSRSHGLLLPLLSACLQASAPDGNAVQRFLQELRTQSGTADYSQHRGARGLRRQVFRAVHLEAVAGWLRLHGMWSLQCCLPGAGNG